MIYKSVFQDKISVIFLAIATLFSASNYSVLGENEIVPITIRQAQIDLAKTFYRNQQKRGMHFPPLKNLLYNNIEY